MRNLKISFETAFILICLFCHFNVKAQYNTCADAVSNPVWDWTSGSPISNCIDIDVPSATASGFFGSGAYVPNCDPGSLNTIDVWVKFTATVAESIYFPTGPSTGQTFLLLENVDCSSNTADEVFCYNKNVSGAEYFVACEALVVGQEYFLVVLIPDTETESLIPVCHSGLATSQPNEECGTATVLSSPVLETCTTGTSIGNNLYTCPEDYDYGGCGVFNVKNTCWYEFTTDALAEFVDIEITSIFNGPQEFILLDGDIGCATTTDVGGCITGESLLGQPILPNHTYYIVVAAELTAVGGSFDINVSVNGSTEAVNDEICDATVLSSGVTATSHNICADQEIFLVSCVDNNFESQVWFTYTTPSSGFNSFTITLGDISMGGAGSMSVYSAGSCSLSGSQLAGPEECDIFNEGPFDYFCISPNTTYFISVGSTVENVGDFEITITDSNGGAAHDICDNAIDVKSGTTISEVMPNCESITISTNNYDGCPENFNDGCGFDVGSAVWYKFETDAGAQFVDIMVENASFSPSIGLYDGNCSSLSLVSCVTDVELLNESIIGGQTYYLLIGTDLPTSDFDLTVIVRDPPANDMCEDVEVLSPGVSVIGTTECAGSDLEEAGCADHYEQTVWYEFTTGTDEWRVNIIFNQLSMGLDAGILIYDGSSCPNTSTMFYYGVCDYTDLEICVIENTTYKILIGSSSSDQGTFEIEYEIISPVIPNDICSGVESLNSTNPIPTDCEEHTFNGNNIGACHETFTEFGCEFDLFNKSVVWYEFMTDSEADFIDINLSNVFFGTPTYGVTLYSSDCTSPTAISGCGEATTGWLTNVNVSPNTTYYLLVGSHLGFAGTYDINITIRNAPENDDCTSSDYVVHDLVSNILLPDESTLCSTPDVAPDCALGQALNTVWYEYQVPSNVREFTIDITNWSSSGDVYLLATEICNSSIPYGNDMTNEYCGFAGIELITVDCPDEGSIIYFLVGTEEGSEGTFDIELIAVEKELVCADNDNCGTPDESTFSGIITNSPSGATCYDDCNRDACPEEFTYGSCMFNAVAGVWYEVTTDGTVNPSLNIQVSSADFNPAIAIFIDDCLTPLSVDTECSIGDGSVAILNNIEVLPNTTYLILVASENGGEGDFTICVDVNTSCNDSPCSPVSLSGGVVYDDPDLYCTTNIGSTEDVTYTTDCDVSIFESSVYFTYQVLNNLSSFILNYENVSMSGDVSLTILNYDASNCETEQTVEVYDCMDVSTPNSLQVFCPVIGNIYLIQVTSTMSNQGDFSLEIEENINNVVNDVCQSATEIDNSLICEEITLSGENTESCPEEFSDSNCTFEDGHFVWFEIEIPTSVTKLDVKVVGDVVLDDPIFAVISSSCNVSPLDFVSDGDCVESSGGVASLDDILVTEGSTYYIVIGSKADKQGSFELTINLKDDACGCPDISLMVPDTICSSSDTLNLQVAIVITEEPGFWTVTNTPVGQSSSGLIIEDSLFIAGDILSGTYDLSYEITNKVAGCDSINTMSLEVIASPVLLDFEEEKGCSVIGSYHPNVFNLLDYVVGVSGAWTVVENPGSVIVSDYMNIDFTGSDIGVYVFEYCTDDGVVPCQNICKQFKIDIIDCTCPPALIRDTIVCNENGDLILSDLLETTEVGHWKFISGGSIVDVTDGVFEHGGILEGDYQLHYNFDSPTVACDSVFLMNIEVEAQPEAMLTTDKVEICGNNKFANITVLDLYDLVLSGDKMGVWSSLDFIIPIDGIIDFDGLLSIAQLGNNYTFTYLLSGNTICNDISYDIVVKINNCECKELEMLPLPDMCNDNDKLNLQDYLSIDTGTGIWESNPVLYLSSNVLDATGVEPGGYILTFTLDDQSPGCITSVKDTIKIWEPGWAGVGTTKIICEGDNELLELIDLLDGDPDFGGLWSSDETTGFDKEAGSFNTTNYAAGSYVFTYSFGVDLICNTLSNVVITVIGKPIADAGLDMILDCENEIVVLDGVSSTVGVTYQWYDSNGLIAGATEITYETMEDGEYYIEVTGANTCSTIDTVFVVLDADRPDFEISSVDISCNGEEDGSIRVINESGGTGMYQYELDEMGVGDDKEWTNLSAGEYTITLIDGNGCKTIHTITIMVPGSLEVMISPRDHIVENGITEELSLSEEVDYSDKTITWLIGDSIICSTIEGDDCKSIEVQINRQTTYCVIIIDDNGCRTEDCITISTNGVPGIYVPTVFSPRAVEEDNQYFYISDDGVIANIKSFNIYSRWGELIYSRKDVKPGVVSEGWDGKYKSEFVNTGVFVYHISIVLKDGKETILMGDIAVIR